MEFNKKFWFYSTILITVMLLTTMAATNTINLNITVSPKHHFHLNKASQVF